MITVGFIQNTEYDEYINDDYEPDWRTVAWYKNKCTLLKLRDSHTILDVEREPDVLVSSPDADSQHLLWAPQSHQHRQ